MGGWCCRKEEQIQLQTGGSEKDFPCKNLLAAFKKPFGGVVDWARVGLEGQQ